jgi:hypothetical protein
MADHAQPVARSNSGFMSKAMMIAAIRAAVTGRDRAQSRDTPGSQTESWAVNETLP